MVDDIADGGVVETVAPGDAAAFARLYRAYLNPLCRFVYSYVKSWETAKDIVEEVFLQVWTRLHTIQPGGNLKSYLYTTARNQAIKYLRHQRVEARHRDAYRLPRTLKQEEAAAPPEADDRLASSELAAMLQRAIDALPRRQREVVLLKWERQATHEEIAMLLGISPKTVTEHFRRAVEYLRQVLPQDW